MLPEDKAKEGELIENFKKRYDTVGCKKTELFDGIELMLKKLYESKNNLSIATNKRIEPTKMILSHLAIKDYFKGIYSLDYFKPSMNKKSEMLQELKKIYQNEICIYVGDREDDGNAAELAKIPFIMVNWGYENKTKNNEIIKKASEINIQLVRQTIIKYYKSSSIFQLKIEN